MDPSSKHHEKQVNHARADPLLKQLEQQWLADFPEVADEARLEMSKKTRSTQYHARHRYVVDGK